MLAMSVNKKTGHWIAYYKTPKNSYHFCSYGSPPPNDLVNYLREASLFILTPFRFKTSGKLTVVNYQCYSFI